MKESPKSIDTQEELDQLMMMGMVTYRFERIGKATITASACRSFLLGVQVAHGQSAYVDLEDYDQILADKIALERCQRATRNKICGPKGYRLARELNISDRVKALNLESADVIQIKAKSNRHDDELIAGIVSYLRDAGKTPLIIIADTDIDCLSEDDMLKAGWVRVEQGASHAD